MRPFIPPPGRSSLLSLAIAALLALPASPSGPGPLPASADGLENIRELVGKLNVKEPEGLAWGRLSLPEKLAKIRSETGDGNLDLFLKRAIDMLEGVETEPLPAASWIALEESGAFVVLDRQIMFGPEEAEKAREEEIEADVRFHRNMMTRAKYSSLAPKDLPPLAPPPPPPADPDRDSPELPSD